MPIKIDIIKIKRSQNIIYFIYFKYYKNKLYFQEKLLFFYKIYQNKDLKS